MDLPINDNDLETIVNALSLGGDARLYHLLKEVKDVRDNNPDGPYKKILRDKVLQYENFYYFSTCFKFYITSFC